MPRIRTIKPEFFRSPDTAKAGYQARVLYAAMWCWADDYGVGETNLNGLLGMAFPDDDCVSKDDLLLLLAEVRECYGVAFYTVRGRHFYEIPSWDEHQKTQRRSQRRFPQQNDPDSMPDLRIPDMQGISESTQGNAPVGKGTEEHRKRKGSSVTLVKGVQGETPVKSEPKQTRRTRIPEDFRPSPDVAESMMTELGCTKEALRAQHRIFCDYWQGQGKPMADWTATWRGWMRRAASRGELGRPAQPSRRTNDDKIQELMEMDING